MMVTISDTVVRTVIGDLIEGKKDRRVVTVLNSQQDFLSFAIEFFTQVAKAKIKGITVGSTDWYSDAFLHPDQSTNDLAMYGGLGKKTIKDMRRSTRKEIVLEESLLNHQRLNETIDYLVDTNTDVDVMLTIKLGPVGVDLTLDETLIVVNALAVKRHQIRAGTASSLGKRVEVPLMKVLCELFGVDRRYRRESRPDDSLTQIDFVLVKARSYRCEVKLAGASNPEGSKGAPATDAQLVVGDQLSESAKAVLEKANVEWVELAAPEGFRRFGEVLTRFGIPHTAPENLDALDDILDSILPLP